MRVSLAIFTVAILFLILFYWVFGLWGLIFSAFAALILKYAPIGG